MYSKQCVVFVFIHLYVYVSMYLCVYVGFEELYVSLCILYNLYIYLCASIYLYVFLCILYNVYIYLCVSIYLYVYMSLCILYIHITNVYISYCVNTQICKYKLVFTGKASCRRKKSKYELFPKRGRGTQKFTLKKKLTKIKQGVNSEKRLHNRIH